MSPETNAEMSAHLFAFLRALHDGGLRIPAPKQLDFLRSIEIIRPVSGSQLYWAARATLTTSNRDTEVFGEDANNFNPRRPEPANGFNRYGLGFGMGTHQCYGLRVVVGNDGKGGGDRGDYRGAGALSRRTHEFSGGRPAR